MYTGSSSIEVDGCTIMRINSCKPSPCRGEVCITYFLHDGVLHWDMSIVLAKSIDINCSSNFSVSRSIFDRVLIVQQDAYTEQLQIQFSRFIFGILVQITSATRFVLSSFSSMS